ncbi:glucosamine-6-phosphate deaminase [Georgenia satyanarayanai]|uniref:Glucosamine-6-phosphate deaminase n=1 Tax=Georgenia satyanarayanai TaxID=860221 RepID=A0A2Y9BX31_9MICO|nr:glucosamine-6-phosphate deaminase [Georgenia satyanarayanai]PYG00089.1 glucosamine-6-phosphate deaminase [Georgenia satyanarayanai]SSA40112.1 glucosamine-6-phosphate deaminase [Georgenia satyanarayanai]
MEVVITSGAQESARLAADAVEQLLARKPDAVLGLATGSTPLPTYDELVRRHEAGQVSFARARGFTLDEYIGLPADHPQRYRNVIDRELVGRVDFASDAVTGPDGLAEDLQAAAEAYERAIAAAGGVDLQILGIGTNGHIAFNEPGSSLASRTRVQPLAPQTRTDNARFFEDDVEAVPRLCFTQGLGTIMEARHLVLIATGEGKAAAVQQLVEGPVSARWPATVMQHHPHATVLLDEAAASRLELADYYREAYAAKPEWQGI